MVRDQEQDVAAKRHLIEPTGIRPERASKVGRGGSRAPTMSAVVARNILDGILYFDKLLFPDVAVNVPASIAPESRGAQAPVLEAHDALSNLRAR